MVERDEGSRDIETRRSCESGERTDESPHVEQDEDKCPDVI
jgi:hypothetical protein